MGREPEDLDQWAERTAKKAVDKKREEIRLKEEKKAKRQREKRQNDERLKQLRTERMTPLAEEFMEQVSKGRAVREDRPIGKRLDEKRLRELREDQVLSLRDLERVSGVSYNTIWRIEDGRQGAHPSTIRRLAAALGVEPRELLKSVDDD